MTGTARVIGLGQDFAGDDAIGLVVARQLQRSAAQVETITAKDATELVDLLATPVRVVLVDGVVGAGTPGRVFELDPAALDHGSAAVSSHALGVAQAVELARALHGASMTPEVRFVGVAIARPTRSGEGLSPAVRSAVERAARLALALATE